METAVKTRLQSIQFGDVQLYKGIAIVPLLTPADGAIQDEHGERERSGRDEGISLAPGRPRRVSRPRGRAGPREPARRCCECPLADPLAGSTPLLNIHCNGLRMRTRASSPPTATASISPITLSGGRSTRPSPTFAKRSPRGMRVSAALQSLRDRRAPHQDVDGIIHDTEDLHSIDGPKRCDRHDSSYFTS